MRISDWSSDVCSSDLPMAEIEFSVSNHVAHVRLNRPEALNAITPAMDDLLFDAWRTINDDPEIWCAVLSAEGEKGFCIGGDVRSEEHTSELQSLMRISYAVFCLKKKRHKVMLSKHNS